MNRTKIDWPFPRLYTWNPVTGCKRGCSYCYARRMHERFNEGPYSDIVFHRDRLYEPYRLKKPATIFVGSMSDVQYWSEEMVLEVISTCFTCQCHTFMFLTKSLLVYQDYTWPANCWLGTTLTGVPGVWPRTPFLRWPNHRYVSLEPLLGPVRTPCPNDIDLVIVGAMTGPGAVKPKPEWIESIRENVPGDKLYWKRSMGQC